MEDYYSRIIKYVRSYEVSQPLSALFALEWSDTKEFRANNENTYATYYVNRSSFPLAFKGLRQTCCVSLKNCIIFFTNFVWETFLESFFYIIIYNFV